jgi:hypothetical protein
MTSEYVPPRSRKKKRLVKFLFTTLLMLIRIQEQSAIMMRLSISINTLKVGVWGGEGRVILCEVFICTLLSQLRGRFIEVQVKPAGLESMQQSAAAGIDMYHVSGSPGETNTGKIPTGFGVGPLIRPPGFNDPDGRRYLAASKGEPAGAHWDAGSDGDTGGIALPGTSGGILGLVMARSGRLGLLGQFFVAITIRSPSHGFTQKNRHPVYNFLTGRALEVVYLTAALRCISDTSSCVLVLLHNAILPLACGIPWCVSTAIYIHMYMLEEIRGRWVENVDGLEVN